MQQPSVANYFRIKKRIRDEPLNNKSAKLVAVSSSSVAGDQDKPNPIRATVAADTVSTRSPETERVNSPEVSSSTIDTNIERKTAKGKRHIPCFKKYHHLVSTHDVEDVEMVPDSTNEPSIGASSSSGHVSSTTAAKETTSGLTLTTNLPLPYKYKVLTEYFRAVETVASIFFNRNEVITFSKVKPAVLELIRTAQLREKHLAQFLTIFPNCYTFAYEKIATPGTKEWSYQLVMIPNLTASSLPSQGGRMTSALMTERRRIFQNSLRDLCHKYHKEFLLSLDPPIELPHDTEVTRWHPKFPINGVPSIDPSPMPKSPESEAAKTTAKEVMARARNIMEAANPRMRLALQELMKKTAAGASAGMASPPAEAPLDSTPKEIAAPAPASNTSDKRTAAREAILKAQQALMLRAKGNPAMLAAVNKVLTKNNKEVIPGPGQAGSLNLPTSSRTAVPEATKLVEEKGNHLNKKNLAALKGVSQSLIDKIRAREQEKAIRCMTLTPQESKQQAMLNRLPEFIKIVRNTMVAEKKSVLALHVIVERLFHSQYQELSHSEVEAHLRLLHKTVPDWLLILKTTQGEFVKIIMDKNINETVEKIEEIIRKAK